MTSQEFKILMTSQALIWNSIPRCKLAVLNESANQLSVFGFVLYLLIDVNCRIRCGIYTCDSQIVSGNVAFQLVIYINV